MGLAFGIATYYILRFMRTCGASHDQQARPVFCPGPGSGLGVQRETQGSAATHSQLPPGRRRHSSTCACAPVPAWRAFDLQPMHAALCSGSLCATASACPPPTPVGTRCPAKALKPGVWLSSPPRGAPQSKTGCCRRRSHVPLARDPRQLTAPMAVRRWGSPWALPTCPTTSPLGQLACQVRPRWARRPASGATVTMGVPLSVPPCPAAAPHILVWMKLAGV